MERTSFLYRIRRVCQVLASKFLPDECLCKLYSRVILKENINLKNPKTFNEKIQWLKIHKYPYNQLVIQASDKYAVREYVKGKGMENILVPLLGKWEHAEDIDWEQLPDSFVLKCNHGCAYNILCPDKNKLNKEITIKHVIICEEYLGASITDYKFFCMNGEPKYIYVSNDLVHDRQAEIGFFYLDGSKMPLKRKDYADLPSITLPPFFDDMKRTARILCQDFTFVRVDFFITNQKYYFAELTFTPSAGMMPFNPREYDLDWGNQLDISNEMVCDQI